MSKNTKRTDLRKIMKVKGHCPHCGHDKKFLGNTNGLMINKCTRCKKVY